MLNTSPTTRSCRGWCGRAQDFSIVCGRRDHFLLRSQGLSHSWMESTLEGRHETQANHSQGIAEASAIRAIMTDDPAPRGT